MNVAFAEPYAGVVSQRVAVERDVLAARWLHRLNELLTVLPNEVFPSVQLLDHIPTLIGEIAQYLRAPADEEIAANTSVMEKARELGLLRYRQHASVHQLLREYEILGDILETFVVAETGRLGLKPSAAECFALLHRLTQSSRILMRTTVDTFVSEYTAAIEERNARIAAFNQTASHELRSPIGTLLFAGATLEREDVRAEPARVARIAVTISNNARRLSWLVENLQRMTRLSDTVDIPNEQRIAVATIANEVARQLDEMAKSRNVRISVREGLPEMWGDPARLELAMINLVSNGIKYNDREKSDSFVEIAPLDDASDGTCAFCVRDNGLGIADGDRTSIFERFFRAHAQLDAEHGVSGSGLGLAIAADCVKAMGGSITCESTLGHGSMFVISLPQNAGLSFGIHDHKITS
jgi:signal transduction histidine kinase